MLLTKWLAVACLSLFFAGTPAFAGTEQRCAELGSQCICAEGLNSATHDGGQTTWTPGQMYNPDDSTAPTQCFPFTGNAGYPADNFIEFYSAQQFIPVPAASLSGVLPPGNTLSRVLRDQGQGVAHIMNPTIQETPGATVCLRSYARWDRTSLWPGTFAAFGQPIITWPNMNGVSQNLGNCDNPGGCTQQQKILTLGGVNFAYGPGDGILNTQISWSQSQPNVEPTIHTRFDGDIFAAPVDFQELGSVRDCTDNFCRLEICVDYSDLGEGRVRMRRTSVAPGSGQVTVFKPVGKVLRPNLQLNNSAGAGAGLAMYAQYFPVVRDNSHFIMTRVRPENRLFWPGPACEVEGGCSGSPAIPVAAPMGLILK